MPKTRTYYTVETLAWREFPQSEGHWVMSGTGPGGKTIEEARDRVKKDMKRIGMERLHDVKFIITKTVEVEEVADEIMGNEASFFMLRT
jgi:hypothetical protein